MFKKLLEIEKTKYLYNLSFILEHIFYNNLFTFLLKSTSKQKLDDQRPYLDKLKSIPHQQPNWFLIHKMQRLKQGKGQRQKYHEHFRIVKLDTFLSLFQEHCYFYFYLSKRLSLMLLCYLDCPNLLVFQNLQFLQLNLEQDHLL